ncbi:dynamin family protein [Bdellovibrionota bacterium FG-2]
MNEQALLTAFIGVTGIVGLASAFYYRYNLRAVGVATFLYCGCVCTWILLGAPLGLWFAGVALPALLLFAKGYLFSWRQSRGPQQLENVTFAVRPERSDILGYSSVLVLGLVGYEVQLVNTNWESPGYLAIGVIAHLANVILIVLTSISRRIATERGPRSRGCLNGDGERIFACGTRETGNFDFGFLQKGRNERPGEGYSEGEFNKDGSLLNGEMQIQVKTGSFCRGSVRDGNFTGKRRNVESDTGTEVEEDVVDGEVTFRTEHSKDGYSYEGHYKDGEWHGLGILKGPKGKHKTGTFEKGEFKDGTIDWIDGDGSAAVGTYRNGTLVQGMWKASNGQVQTGLFRPDDGTLRVGRIELADGGLREGWFLPSGRLSRGKQICEKDKTVLQGRFTETPEYVLEESFLYSLDSDADYETECQKFFSQQIGKSNEATWENLKAILTRLVAVDEKCRGEITDFIKQMDRLSRTKVTRIAVIGEFNSGKSSFINALLGEEVSRTADDECTAIPILIGYDPQTKYFGITTDWTENPLSKADFERFQTQGCNDYKYLKVIGPYPTLSRLNIEIIDTPGVSSKVNGRTEVTLGAVTDADGCFLLMDSAQDGSKSFLEFADKAREIQPRMFFFVSRADMRSDEEILEHIEVTVPKNAKRFKVPSTHFLLIGKAEKRHVCTASKALNVLTSYLLDERASIQAEKIGNFSMLIRTKLAPHITALENVVNTRMSDLKDRPDSFRQIWQSWRKEIHDLDWKSVLQNFNQKIEADTVSVRQDGLARIAQVVDGILFLVDANDIEKVQKIVDSAMAGQKRALSLAIKQLAPNLTIGSNEAARRVYAILDSKGIKQEPFEQRSYGGQFCGPEDIDRYLKYGLYKFIEDAATGAVAGSEAMSNTAALGRGLQIAFRMDSMAVAVVAVGAAVFEGQNKKRELKSKASECLNAALTNLNGMASETIARIPEVTEWLFEKASRILIAKYSELFTDEFTKVKMEKERLQELQKMIGLTFEIIDTISASKQESGQSQKAA